MQKQNTPIRKESSGDSRYFRLYDNRFSTDGGHPLKDDICRARAGEAAEGELHIVTVDGVNVSGRLFRRGGNYVLESLNGSNPIIFSPKAAEAFYRVEQFFYAQDPPAQAAPPKARRTRRTTTTPVIDLHAWKQQHARPCAQ